MYARPFDYHAAESLDEALEMLARAPDRIKLLAGGQSLIPMMNLQIAQPEALLDLNPIRELEGVTYQNGWAEIGALVRHRFLETDRQVRERLPLLAEAAGHIGNLRVRNRGTLGGSLAHADPAAELGAVVLALDARIVAQSLAGSREIPASEFFQGIFATALKPDEIVRAVRFPVRAETRCGFAEFAYRADDFAVAGAAVALQVEDGRIQTARLALFGVADSPLRVEEAEDLLTGEAPSPELAREAAEKVYQAIDPVGDERVSAGYRRRITRVMVRRALASALGLEFA